MDHSHYLPKRFNFFHLGSVEQTTSFTKPLTEQSFILGFHFSGETYGFCVVGFEQMPTNPDEESLFMEMANILVAKFATQFSEGVEGYIKISPPEILNNQHKYRHLIKTIQNITTFQAYEYIAGKKQLNLRVFYLPSLKGES